MKKIFFIFIASFFLATKCSVKLINLQVLNTTNDKYFITYIKDNKTINKLLSEKYIDSNYLMKIDNVIFQPNDFIEPSYQLYESKNDANYCIFYIIKQNDYNSKNYIFDSLVIPKKDIKLEKEGLTQIFIEKDSIYYKSW